MSILMSMFVVIINGVLSKVIRMFSVYERHRTYTAYNLSVASKLTLALFINTAVIPIFANLPHTSWFTSSKCYFLNSFLGGLAADVFYRILTIAFFGPFMYAVDPGYLIKLIKRRIEKGKGASSKLCQRDANTLFENGPVDMAQRYATTMNLFLLVCFYTPLIPVSPLIGLMGGLASYWVDKSMLVRRHKMPEMMGSTMAKFFSNTVPYAMILYGVGNHVFV